MNWVTFTRRTDDPKLAFIEHLLTEAKIPHRRHGRSFHAPILLVPSDRHAEAWKILTATELDGQNLDTVSDDHPAFAWFTPHDWLGEGETR